MRFKLGESAELEKKYTFYAMNGILKSGKLVAKAYHEVDVFFLVLQMGATKRYNLA